ncbi:MULTISPECIES: hypothetical protein [unclassified Luteococcus]|uniref:hypothetical protein n=1 Tax=unclassified Luteococcus TaxID=2639923 RepID=UPI00313AC67C
MTGLFYVAIVLAWIAFLVPSFVSRRDGADDDDLDLLGRFGDTARIIAPAGIVSSDEDADVSTPLTRRAARAEIRDTARRAARRRRTVVLGLLGLTVLTVAGVAIDAVIWWTPLVPLGMLLAFLVVARFSVVRLNAVLDERLAELETDWQEDTISFEVPSGLRAGGITTDSVELSIEISAPINGLAGSLWEPIPVTVPTYVSKPMVPRTVRTIDLSAPGQVTAQQPVVAEAPEQPVETRNESQERPRAVGE